MQNLITYHQLSLSIRFNTILFPFELSPFFKGLEKNGFLLDEQIAAAPFGARLEVGGIVARKAETSVKVDTSRNVLGVNNPDPNELVDELTRIETLVRNELGFDTSKAAQFYEILVTTTQEAKTDLLVKWGQRFSGDPLLQKISNMVGKPVLPFGIKFASKAVIPNHSDWFEINVFPAVLAPSEKHSVQVVYRNVNRDDVISFTRRLNTFLEELVRTVEQ